MARVGYGGRTLYHAVGRLFRPGFLAVCPRYYIVHLSQLFCAPLIFHSRFPVAGSGDLRHLTG